MRNNKFFICFFTYYIYLIVWTENINTTVYRVVLLISICSMRKKSCFPSLSRTFSFFEFFQPEKTLSAQKHFTWNQQSEGEINILQITFENIFSSCFLRLQNFTFDDSLLLPSKVYKIMQTRRMWWKTTF